MLVWNTFQYDARVRREAGSLSRAGWQVNVVAVHQPGLPRVEREEHWRVQRISLDPPGIGLVREIFRRSPPIEGSRAGIPSEELIDAGSTLVQPRAPRMVRELLRLVRGVIGNAKFLFAAIQSRPAVVHAHDLNTLLPGLIAARITGARLVYDAHEIKVHQHLVPYRRLWRLLERALIKRADAVIATTLSRAAWFAQTYSMDAPVVLQNMVEYQEVLSSTKLHHLLNIPEQKHIVLYQGGLQRGRGLKTLLRAAPALQECVVVLLGYGAQRPELTAIVREGGLGERVRFAAPVPPHELLGYTASARVGVQLVRNTCLNHYTTDSNKLFEYIMAGVPVVASDLPEIRRVVEHYNIGILVDPEDPAAVRAAIDRLLSDDDLHEQLRANTRAAAVECNWQVQESRLLDLYAALT